MELVGETIRSLLSNAGLKVESDSDSLGPATIVREISRVDPKRRHDNADQYYAEAPAEFPVKPPSRHREPREGLVTEKIEAMRVRFGALWHKLRQDLIILPGPIMKQEPDRPTRFIELYMVKRAFQ